MSYVPFPADPPYLSSLSAEYVMYAAGTITASGPIVVINNTTRARYYGNTDDDQGPLDITSNCILDTDNANKVSAYNQLVTLKQDIEALGATAAFPVGQIISGGVTFTFNGNNVYYKSGGISFNAGDNIQFINFDQKVYIITNGNIVFNECSITNLSNYRNIYWVAGGSITSEYMTTGLAGVFLSNSFSHTRFLDNQILGNIYTFGSTGNISLNDNIDNPGTSITLTSMNVEPAALTNPVLSGTFLATWTGSSDSYSITLYLDSIAQSPPLTGSGNSRSFTFTEEGLLTFKVTAIVDGVSSLPSPFSNGIEIGPQPPPPPPPPTPLGQSVVVKALIIAGYALLVVFIVACVKIYIKRIMPALRPKKINRPYYRALF